MKKIICGPDNVKEFNQMLKAEMPEFHELAKELYTAGMMDGLRGATIEYGAISKPDGYRVKPAETKHCEECRQWRRDTVGLGQGIGTCLINSLPRVLKWPKQDACEKFERLSDALHESG